MPVAINQPCSAAVAGRRTGAQRNDPDGETYECFGDGGRINDKGAQLDREERDERDCKDREVDGLGTVRVCVRFFL